MTRAPEQITLLTCIGCGAIGGLGDCPAGCSELRLELVPAEAFARLGELASQQDEHVAALLPIARRLRDLGDDNPKLAYLRLQTRARAVLREHPAVDWERAELELRPEAVTAWWCAQCGAVDAPQPCLGVCIRRPAEWVNHDAYEKKHQHFIARRRVESDLRGLVRRVAVITPHDGYWQQTITILHHQATHTLERDRSDAGQRGSRDAPRAFSIAAGITAPAG